MSKAAPLRSCVERRCRSPAKRREPNSVTLRIRPPPRASPWAGTEAPRETRKPHEAATGS
jgi:hypothetical protein